MAVALASAELKVMDVVWQNGGTCPARLVVTTVAQLHGYSYSASYTLITRCIKKGALERVEPGYTCRALVSRQEIRDEETDGLIDRFFGGSSSQLLAALVDRGKISTDDIERLRALADGIDEG